MSKTPRQDRGRRPNPAEPTGPDGGLIFALLHPKEWIVAIILRWLERRWRGLSWIAVTVVAAIVGATYWSPLGVVILVLSLGLFIGTRRRRPVEDQWWHEAILARHFVSAGILRMTDGPDGKATTLPMLSRRGAPQHDDHGTSVTVALPQARELADVAGARGRLASSLRVPVRLVSITQDADDPANVVRLHVGSSTAPKSVTAAIVAVADAGGRTRWHEPVRCGTDVRGRGVMWIMFETNTLGAGIPGTGKTTLGRHPIGHTLLDPDAQLYVIDGKGSRRDYSEARPLCAGFVTAGEDLATDAAMLLEDIRRLIAARNASDLDDHPGVLLVLEEWQEVRAAADKGLQEQLDLTLGRIIRLGRAVAVHVLILTQRPSAANDLPSSVRNLLVQRVALQTRNAADAQLVLGETPKVALPSKRREGIYSGGGELVPFTVDELTPEQWTRVVAHATVLRGARRPSPAPPPPRSATGETLALPASPGAERLADRDVQLLELVVSILRDADPRGLPASEIHLRLQARAGSLIVDRDARALGVLLGGCSAVERGHVGSVRVWRLAPSSRANLSDAP